jgi:hypothetical protein
VSGDEGPSAMTVSAHVGDDGRVICHTYRWTTPILVVSVGPASVTISIKDGRDDMPAPAVAFASALAASAQRFADECERLHALHHGQASNSGRAQAPAQVAAGQTP